VLKATLRGVLAHKLRLALTAFAVVLGVGFVAGTYILTDTISQSFDTLFHEVSSGVDVSVRSVSGFGADDSGNGQTTRNPIPSTVLPAVAAVDGVKVAEGGVIGYAQIVAPGGKAITTTGAPTLGVNWNQNAGLGPLRLRAGRAPTGPGQVAIDAGTSKANDVGVGAHVKILSLGPPEDFGVVGIVGFGEADNLAGATLAAFDTTTAQRVLGKVGQYDTIDMQAVEGVSAIELRTRVEKVLPKACAGVEPAGCEAVTGDQLAQESADQVQGFIKIFKTALLVFAVISLFVGAFIIVNTFSILVAQRTRELALLRALGASRRQVMTSVVIEAAVVGLVASAVGVAVGILIAVGLQSLLGAFGIDLPSTGTVIRPRTIVVAMLTGTVVTVIATLGPARRASRVPPMAALTGAATDQVGSLTRRSITGLVVLVLGAALLTYGPFGGGGIALVGLGAALTFEGVFLGLPLVARPLARAIGWPLARVARLSGKLGRENAMRNPRRTAATAGALTIGLGLVGCVSVLASSFVASGAAIIDKAVAADYILSTDQFTPTISPDLARRLDERPEIGPVSGIQTGPFEYKGSSQSLVAGDAETLPQLMNIDIVSGTVGALARGEVLVEKQAAEDKDLVVGGDLPMTFLRTGTQTLTVGGTYEKNQLLGSYVVSTDVYLANYTEALDFLVLAKAAPGVAPAAAREAVDQVAAGYPNVKVRDQVEFKAEQKRQINQTLGLVSALLVFSIIIAFLGIINTLALSVFERTREIGLLRAVGMARRQVKAVIRAESVIISVLGAVVGLGVGLLFGLALFSYFKGEGIDKLVIPVGSLVVYVVVAGVAGVFAAWFPARRASRLNVLEAISHE
jgi:putative ABC transport system permease protein